jgi:hypothetical protein
MNRDELVRYIEGTIDDLNENKLNLLHHDTDGTPPYCAKKAVDHAFKTDFINRILNEPRYIYNLIARQVIECKMEPVMDSGAPLLDLETCELEFAVLRLYYLKMTEHKKEPFPPDYNLFVFRFMSVLAFHEQIAILVQRIVPEQIWLSFYPFLCQKQDCMLQSNYNEENSFNYMIDHLMSLALRHEMGNFCPIPMNQ